MTSTANELPYFVRKQVELATQKLKSQVTGCVLSVEVQGSRVLVKEVVPHPTKATTIMLPLALLDYKPEGWALLARAENGHWQFLPDEAGLRALDEQIQRFIDDDYKVFWRQ